MSNKGMKLPPRRKFNRKEDVITFLELSTDINNDTLKIMNLIRKARFAGNTDYEQMLSDALSHYTNKGTNE